MMISIVLPCYNEQDNITALCQRLDSVAESNEELEIILVDNGSTDNTAHILKNELSSRKGSIFKIITVEKNIGYGFGILTGLRAAQGQVLSVTHADRQTDPMDILKAVSIYRQHKDENLLVKGFRKNRRFMEAIFSYGMGLLASISLGTRLTEINAQPKVFSKSFFDKIEKDAPHDFSLDLYLLFMAKKNGRIVDFPVFFEKRVAGEAKGGSGSNLKVKWKLVKRSLNYIFELRKKLR